MDVNSSTVRDQLTSYLLQIGAVLKAHALRDTGPRGDTESSTFYVTHDLVDKKGPTWSHSACHFGLHAHCMDDPSRPGRRRSLGPNGAAMGEHEACGVGRVALSVYLADSANFAGPAAGRDRFPRRHLYAVLGTCKVGVKKR